MLIKPDVISLITIQRTLDNNPVSAGFHINQYLRWCSLSLINMKSMRRFIISEISLFKKLFNVLHSNHPLYLNKGYKLNCNFSVYVHTKTLSIIQSMHDYLEVNMMTETTPTFIVLYVKILHSESQNSLTHITSVLKCHPTHQIVLFLH